MDSRKEVENSLRGLLKSAGYRKSRLSWHRSSETAVSVLNLQKSSWSDLYYINCGVSLLGLDPNPRPPEYKCHIRIRVEPLVDHSLDSGLAEILDFEDHSLTPEERRNQLRDLVATTALPWLDSLFTEEQAAALLDSLPSGTIITREAKNYLRRTMG